MVKKLACLVEKKNGGFAITRKRPSDFLNGDEKPEEVDPIEARILRDSLFCVHRLEYLLIKSAETDQCVYCEGYGEYCSKHYRAFGDLSSDEVTRFLEIEEDSLKYLDAEIASSVHLGDGIVDDDFLKPETTKRPSDSDIFEDIDDEKIVPEEIMRLSRQYDPHPYDQRRKWRVK